jgi:dihydrofolate synthase / folylpolyglutamate synthase
MDYFRAKRYLDTLPDWETGRPPSGPLEDYLPRMRALLARLGDPQRTFRSIIVGGTNGKGTVSSLLAALALAAGTKVGLYTSPHLHTQRERIAIDGHLLSKDEWAAAVVALYDCTRDFEREGWGAFSKFEALTALAVYFFARAEVEWGVFEVGLGGRYDATNAWDSEVAVLTRVGLDHVGILGDTLVQIAADKVHIARADKALYTTAAQERVVMELLRDTCAKKSIDLHVAGAQPTDVPQYEGRAASYEQNAALALATARGIGLVSNEVIAQEVVAEHQWPGRFERASVEPLVVLDGAHNTQAASGLASDLARLREEWTLVIGMGDGHDAAGLLAALVPVAGRVLLTASDHPKAQSAEDMAQAAPAGMRVEVVPTFDAALRLGAQAADSGEALCVTGSLFLVARAREFFALPCERDSITEDMALENLTCLQQACDQLELACEVFSEEGTLLRVDGRARPFYFWRNKHPFNDYMGARIAEDKAFQYEIFTRVGLPVPATLQIFNPLADPRFDRYKTHGSIAEIAAEAEDKLSYPLVVKKYRSSLAQGVFLEPDGLGLARRLQQIFENSGYLDNIVLIQQYVAGPEYRAVASRGELLLAYGKEGGEGQNDGDLNPLHNDGRAVRVVDPDLLAAMRELVARIGQVVELGFYAVDLIEAKNGLQILELNPNPFCYFYNKDNGRSDFTRIYRELLQRYIL